MFGNYGMSTDKAVESTMAKCFHYESLTSEMEVFDGRRALPVFAII